MAVFEIKYKKPATAKAEEQIADELYQVGAREIEANRWLLAGTPEQVKLNFVRLKAGLLPGDVLLMKELHKSDLVDRGYLSDDEFTRYREEAKE
jgi:hypothetical protein